MPSRRTVTASRALIAVAALLPLLPRAAAAQTAPGDTLRPRPDTLRPIRDSLARALDSLESRPDSVPSARDSLREFIATARPLRSCNGREITRVDVDAERPTFGGNAGRWRAFAHSMGLHHTTTSADVIRRYLLIAPGDRCTELGRRESERILRGQPFLARAYVRAYDDGPGRTRIVVETQDAIPVIVGGSVAHKRVNMLRLGNSNIGGEGVLAEASWYRGTPFRDGYDAKVTDYQAFGRPYILSLAADRGTIGGGASASLSHPFLTDFQRIAWNATYAGDAEYYGLLRPDPDRNSLIGLRREYWDVGGVFRVGPPGHLSLFGASLSRDRTTPGGFPLRVSDSGLVRDSLPELIGRYPGLQVAHANLLLGWRNLRFIQARHFESLNADEDIRKGLQVGGLIGRSIGLFGGTMHDLQFASDLYAGDGSPASFVAFEGHGEARREQGSGRWDDLLIGGRGAWYLRAGARQTIVESVEYGGGWRQRTPFQLTLGDVYGGLRGFGASDVAGGVRSVVRSEDRIYMGPFRHLADVGLAPFVDVGKVWAGDVPFGRTTPLRVGTGIGLLLAVPPNTRRVWRADLAYPVTRQYKTHLEIRISNVDYSRYFWNEPGDIARARLRTIPTNVFTWP